MFSLLSTLLNRENRSDSLPDMIPQEAAKSFSRFFQEKIETIRQEFKDDPLDTTENSLPVFIPVTCSLVFRLSPKTKS